MGGSSSTGGDGSSNTGGLSNPLGPTEIFIIAGVCSVVTLFILVIFAIILCCCLYYKKCRRGELKNIETQEIIAEDSAEIAVKLRKTKSKEQQLKSKVEKETSEKISQQQKNTPKSIAQKSSDKQNKIKPANEDRTKNPVNRNGTQTDGKNITTRSTSVGGPCQPASKGSRQPVPKSGPNADTEARKSLSFASGTKSSSCKPQRPAPTRPRSSTRNGSAKSDQPNKSKNRSTNQTKKSVSVNTKTGNVAYQKNN